MRYLLDTNAVSDLIRNTGGNVRQAVQQVGVDAVCTSIIVSAELRYGARKRGSDELTGRVEGVLERLTVLPFEPPADHVYGELRYMLEQQGTPISGNDLLIAAQALSGNLIVVTDNVREFSRVDGLVVENWLRP